MGEGRGSRCLKQDGGDTNKALKMSEKSALIDAILRTGALSEVFTQDLGDPDDTAPVRESSQDQRARIWTAVKRQAPEATTREAVEAWIKEKTGLPLHPDQYAAIIARIGA